MILNLPNDRLESVWAEFYGMNNGPRVTMLAGAGPLQINLRVRSDADFFVTHFIGDLLVQPGGPLEIRNRVLVNFDFLDGLTGFYNSPTPWDQVFGNASHPNILAIEKPMRAGADYNINITNNTGFDIEFNFLLGGYIVVSDKFIDRKQLLLDNFFQPNAQNTSLTFTSLENLNPAGTVSFQNGIFILGAAPALGQFTIAQAKSTTQSYPFFLDRIVTAPPLIDQNVYVQIQDVSSSFNSWFNLPCHIRLLQAPASEPYLMKIPKIYDYNDQIQITLQNYSLTPAEVPIFFTGVRSPFSQKINREQYAYDPKTKFPSQR